MLAPQIEQADAEIRTSQSSPVRSVTMKHTPPDVVTNTNVSLGAPGVPPVPRMRNAISAPSISESSAANT